MEYNYHQERQENRPNLETSQEHQQTQQTVHYQHPQYHPQHHAIQPGYPTLGFGSYINPLHTSGPSQSQVSRQGELLRSRAPSTDTISSVTTGRASGQIGPVDFENVLAAGLHVTTSVQHQLSSENTGPDANYHIEDLSNPAHSRAISSTIRVDSHQSIVENSSAQSRAATPSSRRRGQRTTKKILQQWADRANVQSFTRSCQTEPLFEESSFSDAREPSASDLPDYLRYEEVSDTRTKRLGVFASKDLEAAQRFGPFTGDFVKEGLGCYNPATWEICVQGRTWFYIDGASDPNNWMNHVRVARIQEEQNVEAFQFYGSIFFRTTRAIKSGEELRVFYSEDYRRCVGLKSNLDELSYDKVSNRFECQDCKSRYANPKSLMRHFKFEHDKENKSLGEIGVDAEALENDSQISTSSKRNALKKLNLDIKKKRQVNFDKGTKTALRMGNPRSKGTGAGRRKAEPKKLFVCRKCAKQFPTEGRLKEHAAFHAETKHLKPVCDICGLECKNKKALRYHMLSHDSKSHQCHHCKEFFLHKKQLIDHLRQNHNETVGGSGKWIRGSIEEYLSRYVGPAEANEEAEPFHPDLPKDMLGKHILMSSKKPKVFKCKFCPKKFAGRHDVISHEKTMHTNSGKFKCEFCPANFMEERCLVLHQMKHTKQRPYRCKECPRSFSSEKALINHQPEHKGERPFRCDICSKAYRTRKDMTTHRRRQHTTPSMMFKCCFCDKTFREKKNLERHEHRHKGLRPHVCLTCGKAFGAKYTLQQHALVHTGEKPFECKVCQKRFRHNHHLIGHMLIHDKEKELPEDS